MIESPNVRDAKEKAVRGRLLAADYARPQDADHLVELDHSQSYLDRPGALPRPDSLTDGENPYLLWDVALSLRQIVILLDDIRRKMK